MDLRTQAAGIGALADDTRRALYEYVVASAAPVARDQAATALALPLHTATFHLDRLAAEGLLDVEFRRLTGRSGPGAGRPSKLYRRADREYSVSLPPRRYDIVGDILAAAVSRVGAGTGLDQAVHECAHAEGVAVAGDHTADPTADPTADRAADGAATLTEVAAVLAGQGYEPRVGDAGDGALLLANCPFDALAHKHRALVCGMNRSFVQGVLDGLGCTGVEATLEPEPGWCCVKARPLPEDPAVAEVRRWEASGGHWRVLADTGESLTLGLLTCDGGEEMGRVTSAEAALREYVAGRAGSDD